VKKSDVVASRLLDQHDKFAPHIMVSAGVSFEGKGRLHFIEEKAKINANYTHGKFVAEAGGRCSCLAGNNFVFQQDGAPAHGAMRTQEWIDFIGKDSWLPNSPDLNPLDYCAWGAMLEEFHKFNSKPQNTSELKIVLQTISDKLS